ncbi:MAG: hypothetical protein U0P45_15730 [Acidimicrobiales bacterium]
MRPTTTQRSGRGARRRPVAGMFCEGEIAPVAGRHAVHGMSVGVLLLGDLER